MPREIQTHVQLANMALRILQASPIESFDEDSVNAHTLKMYYNVVLRRCLSAYPWAFSLRQEQLQQLPASPLPQYPFAYKLPPDLVSLKWLRTGQNSIPSAVDLQWFEVVSGNLVCMNNEPPIFARYQYEAPVEYFPHYFIDFFVSSLVEECSAVFGYNLVGQRTYKDRIFSSHGKLSEAIRSELALQPAPTQRFQNRLMLERNW